MANRSTRCGIRLVLAGGAFGTFAALRALDDTFGGCWPPSLWMLGRGKLPQHVLRVRSCSKLAAALDYNSTAEARGSRLHSTYDTKRTSNHRVPAGEKSEVFTCASDGGYATTLLSAGILVRALRSGQMFAMEDMPVAVPAHIWDVLLAHKDQFPYRPEKDERGVEVHPWRVPWMLR
ncbi:MAG: hypothetical protein E6G77_23900 [Alphaproteobacteria bacterium]|nr:MAG: hypothetical protein E6G77_23900 [Alphaproteobacteria bacterium]